MPDKLQQVDRKCFIICPLGQDGSEKRRISDDLCENVIKPALKIVEYTPIRIDERAGLVGPITTEIKKEIKSAYLVIADLRGLNANVMYELGYRHAINERCILLIDQGTEVPFDIDISKYQHFKYYVEGNARVNRESKRKMLDFIIDAIKKIEDASIENSLHNAIQTTIIKEFHQGRDIHYEKSLVLLEDNSSRITRILMLQRSSTFIAGPKLGSSNEWILYMRVKKIIEEQDTEFYHLISLDGLKKELCEEGINEKYTKMDISLNNLATIENKELVGLLGFKGKIHQFKQLRRQYDIENQVRFFIVEREDKTCKAIVVFKYGHLNCSIIISGPIATTLLEHGVVLYEQSEEVTWDLLGEVLRSSVPEGFYNEKIASFF